MILQRAQTRGGRLAQGRQGQDVAFDGPMADNCPVMQEDRDLTSGWGFDLGRCGASHFSARSQFEPDAAQGLQLRFDDALQVMPVPQGDADQVAFAPG